MTRPQTPDPERIVIELRPRVVKLASGQPWPVVIRLRQALKTLGRIYGFDATIVDEIPVTPAAEPAPTPNRKDGHE